MAKVIRRCSPFSEEESAILFDILRKHLNVIECENFDILSIAIRSNTWQLVCEEFNSHSSVKQRSQIQLKRFWENRKAKIKRGLHKLLTANNEIAKASSNPIDVQLFDYSTPVLKTPPTPVDGTLFDFSNNSLEFSASKITPHHINPANFSIIPKEKNKLRDLKGHYRSMLEPENVEDDSDTEINHDSGEPVDVQTTKSEVEARLARLQRAQQQQEELHMYRLREAVARAATAEVEQRAAEDAESWAIEERHRAAQREAELHRLTVERMQLEMELLRKQAQHH